MRYRTIVVLEVTELTFQCSVGEDVRVTVGESEWSYFRWNLS